MTAPGRPHAVLGVVCTGAPEPPKHPRLYGMFANTIRPNHSTVEVPEHAEARFTASMVIVVRQHIERFTRPPDLSDDAFGLTSGLTVHEPSWYAEELSVRAPSRLVGSSIESWALVGDRVIDWDDTKERHVRSRLNGELVEESDATLWKPSPISLLSYLSRYLTLESGDLIFMRPPADAMSPHRPLTLGDRIAADVQGAEPVDGVVSWLALDTLELSDGQVPGALR